MMRSTNASHRYEKQGHPGRLKVAVVSKNPSLTLELWTLETGVENYWLDLKINMVFSITIITCLIFRYLKIKVK